MTYEVMKLLAAFGFTYDWVNGVMFHPYYRVEIDHKLVVSNY
jgi:hypothetical protein